MHYIFEQRPHQMGGKLCVATLPSVSPSDVGIQFMTGDSFGKLFRWSYEQGSAMRVEPLVPSDRGRGHGAVKDVLWSNERSELWLGLDALTQPGTDNLGFLTEWDITATRPTAKVDVHGPILNIHQMSENVILAEVRTILTRFHSLPLTQIHHTRLTIQICNFSCMTGELHVLRKDLATMTHINHGCICEV